MSKFYQIVDLTYDRCDQNATPSAVPHDGIAVDRAFMDGVSTSSPTLSLEISTISTFANASRS